MTANPPAEAGSPVLPGYIERRTRGVAGPAALLLRVWCCWCCSWHTQGLAGATPGDVTDRAAHCFAPDSPYEQTGYRIRVTAAPFFTVRSTLQQATRNQRATIRRGRVSAAVQRLRDQSAPADTAPTLKRPA